MDNYNNIKKSFDEFYSDSRDGKWEKLGDIITDGNVQTIILSAHLKDQGWGYQKGMLGLALIDNGKQIEFEKLCEPTRDGYCYKELTVSMKLVSNQKAGMKYEIQAHIGGGGGHTLGVKEC